MPSGPPPRLVAAAETVAGPGQWTSWCACRTTRARAAAGPAPSPRRARGRWCHPQAPNAATGAHHSSPRRRDDHRRGKRGSGAGGHRPAGPVTARLSQQGQQVRPATTWATRASTSLSSRSCRRPRPGDPVTDDPGLRRQRLHGSSWLAPEARRARCRPGARAFAPRPGARPSHCAASVQAWEPRGTRRVGATPMNAGAAVCPTRASTTSAAPAVATARGALQPPNGQLEVRAPHRWRSVAGRRPRTCGCCGMGRDPVEKVRHRIRPRPGTPPMWPL